MSPRVRNSYPGTLFLCHAPIYTAGDEPTAATSQGPGEGSVCGLLLIRFGVSKPIRLETLGIQDVSLVADSVRQYALNRSMNCPLGGGCLSDRRIAEAASSCTYPPNVLSPVMASR